MSNWQIYSVIWLGSMVVLAIAGLTSRRIPMPTIIRGTLGWLAIGLVVYLLVAYGEAILASLGL